MKIMYRLPSPTVSFGKYQPTWYCEKDNPDGTDAKCPIPAEPIFYGETDPEQQDRDSNKILCAQHWIERFGYGDSQ